MLTFGSWCSGIEAASEAWLPLGWRCAYVAEIEPFPCAYLAQTHGAGRPRYMPSPEDAETAEDRRRRAAMIKALGRIDWGDRLPNLGDISQVRADELAPVDIIAAGFPCQDFSIAGLRASLAGARGSISTIGVRLLLEAAELGLVRGAVLEQVPDVLNTADNAWGNILGALVGADAALEGLEHGGKWPRAGMVAGPRARIAWRILDAQHFRLAQRRERVWAVVDFGDGPDPAAVLFERKGLHGHPAPRRRQTEDVAPTVSGGARKRGGYSYDDIPAVADGPQRRAAFGGNNTSGPIDVATARTASHTASGRQDFETETFLVEASADLSPSLRAQAQASHRTDSEVYIAHTLRGAGFDASEDGTGRGTPLVPVEPIAFNARQDPISGPVVGPVDTDGGTHAIAFSCKDHGADAGPIAPTMRAMGHSGSHTNAGGQVAVAFSLRGREGGAMPEVEDGDLSPALRAAEGGSTRPFLAFDETQITSPTNRSQPLPGQPTHPLTAKGRPPTLASPMAVRRITVVEAERLQGFPDNATLIRWPSATRTPEDFAETAAYLRHHGFGEAEAQELARTPDGPRYKAIGNSWPVTVARWIGERIASEMGPAA